MIWKPEQVPVLLRDANTLYLPTHLSQPPPILCKLGLCSISLSYYEVQRHLSLNPALLSGTEITLEALPFPQAHFFQVTFMEQQSKDL